MKKQKAPLCPECGSDKVGFSDTDELKCWCVHLFKPPPHLQGKGSPKERRFGLPSRFKKDRVYWWVNDLIVKATAYGGYFPESYLQWQMRHPSGSLEKWIKSEVDKRMSWKQIQEDLRLYKHSAEPDIVLKIVTSLRHCDEKVLKGPSLHAVAPYLSRRSAESLALAFAELLPAWREIPKRENYPEWITYKQAGEIKNDAPWLTTSLIGW